MRHRLIMYCDVRSMTSLNDLDSMVPVSHCYRFGYFLVMAVIIVASGYYHGDVVFGFVYQFVLMTVVGAVVAVVGIRMKLNRLGIDLKFRAAALGLKVMLDWQMLMIGP